MVIKRIFTLSTLTLLTALTLSSIAAWYSILGLTAIFAAAVVPIIIMGGALEIAKVVTTVWLHRYWDRVGWSLKIYLVPAVVSLAFLTSMGIFGFLSKAHMDQGVPVGEIAAKVSILDEKIKISKENIEVNRKALKQLDEAVDQVMSRSTSEGGADKAVAIRKSQASDRKRLLAEITTEQKVVSQLNTERAPIASELRKVEAEVGPIKYIAALMYGDQPDQNVLERAVRWVIILIVFVFDPLALTLVIAATTSYKWEVVDEEPESNEEENKEPEPVLIEEPKAELVEEPEPEIKVEEPPPEVIEEPEIEIELEITKHDGVTFDEKLALAQDEVPEIIPEVAIPESEPEAIVEEVIETPVVVAEIIGTEMETSGVTKQKPYEETGSDYVLYEGKSMKLDALKAIKPEYFMLNADDTDQTTKGFGIQFPKMATKGSIFVRVDIMPNRVFKFDGLKWIEINKTQTDTYLHDKEYIQYLITKIDAGEYDVELLSDYERFQIEQWLQNQKA